MACSSTGHVEAMMHAVHEEHVGMTLFTQQRSRSFREAGACVAGQVPGTPIGLGLDDSSDPRRPCVASLMHQQAPDESAGDDERVPLVPCAGDTLGAQRLEIGMPACLTASGVDPRVSLRELRRASRPPDSRKPTGAFCRFEHPSKGSHSRRGGPLSTRCHLSWAVASLDDRLCSGSACEQALWPVSVQCTEVGLAQSRIAEREALETHVRGVRD